MESEHEKENKIQFVYFDRKIELNFYVNQNRNKITDKNMEIEGLPDK